MTRAFWNQRNQRTARRQRARARRRVIAAAVLLGMFAVICFGLAIVMVHGQ